MPNPSAQTMQQLDQQPDPRPWNKKAFYIYSMPFLAVASGGSQTQQLNIEANSDFIIRMITATVIDNTVPETVRPKYATLQLNDTGSGANLFNTAIPISNFAGDGTLPFILPIPKVLMASSTLTGNLVNFASTNALSYYVSFIGAKVYPL